VRRTVWDGAQELAEIQVPVDLGNAAIEEMDTGYPVVSWNFSPKDPNPFFGRVVYGPGLSVHKPLTVTRYEYRDQPSSGSATLTWPRLSAYGGDVGAEAEAECNTARLEAVWAGIEDWYTLSGVGVFKALTGTAKNVGRTAIKLTYLGRAGAEGANEAATALWNAAGKQWAFVRGERAAGLTGTGIIEGENPLLSVVRMLPVVNIGISLGKEAMACFNP
jgi:hypothetical protein